MKRRLEIRRASDGVVLAEATLDATTTEVAALADCLNLAIWPPALQVNIVDVGPAQFTPIIAPWNFSTPSPGMDGWAFSGPPEDDAQPTIVRGAD